MTREEFDALVRRIEQRYAGRPQRLRLAVVSRALLGYGWFAGWIAFVLLLAGGLIAAGIAAGPDGVMFHVFGSIVLVWGLAVVLRIVRVRLSPIEGRRVTPSEAPALFQALSDLRKNLKTIPFHRVLIVTDINASVVQQPLLGVFGWWRNYLLLGMPLLEMLSEQECLAVLAHEFAHLSRHHGRLSHWLYRLRRAWEQIFASLQTGVRKKEISLKALSARFSRWFWPRFNAHAFVLSRANEYEADRVAAELVGMRPMMSALSRLAANREFLDEKFWPGIRQLAAEMPEPPSDLISYFRTAIGSELAVGEMEKNWAQELRSVTTNADTHPCLNDRLNALKWDGKPVLSALSTPSAAEAFLGPSLEAIRKDVNAHWRKQLTKTWSGHNARAAMLNRRLDSLSTVQHINADTLWDQACMRMELENSEQVEPLLREILQARPTHVGALIALGSSLLERNDSTGEELLEQAVGEDEERVPQVCNILQNYFRRTGQADAIRKIAVRMDLHDRTLVASRQERSSISPKDTLVSHELSSAELEPLHAALREFPDIHAAHLGRKQLKHFARQRLFLLCIRLKSSWLGRVDETKERAIISKLTLSSVLPGRVLIFGPRGSFSRIARKLHRLPDSKIL